MGIKPKIGPITGGQEISIEGLDFVPTSEVLIRFSSRARGTLQKIEQIENVVILCHLY